MRFLCTCCMKTTLCRVAAPDLPVLPGVFRLFDSRGQIKSEQRHLAAVNPQESRRAAQQLALAGKIGVGPATGLAAFNRSCESLSLIPTATDTDSHAAKYRQAAQACLRCSHLRRSLMSAVGMIR